MSTVMENAIGQVLDQARGKGVKMEVLAAEQKSTGIAFQKRRLEDFSFAETRQLGVRVFDGKHEGIAYTENLSPDSLALLVEEALGNARMIEREWTSHLAGADNRLPTLDGIYSPGLEEISAEHKLDAARTLETAALDYDKRIESVERSRYADSCSRIWITNTIGLYGSYVKSSVSAFASCLAHDGEARVISDASQFGRSFEKLNFSSVAREAAEKTLNRLGARRPSTGRYTVVLENRVAEDLMHTIGGYLSAKAVDERTSPLAGKLGQSVFSPLLTLVDDPFRTDAASCRPFDAEGYASRKTPLVEKGVLKNYLTNSVLARKMNLPHTASATRAPATDLDVSATNLVVEPGTHTFGSLVDAAPRVIVITELMGRHGLRATSGDFSIPAEGYLYENGKRAYALKDFLISGNILQLFSTVEAVGQDALPPISDSICPSLLVRDLNVSGQA